MSDEIMAVFIIVILPSGIVGIATYEHHQTVPVTVVPSGEIGETWKIPGTNMTPPEGKVNFEITGPAYMFKDPEHWENL